MFFKLPKLKVYCQLQHKGCLPRVNPNGEWIDLRSAEDVEMGYPQAGVLHQENNKLVRNVTFSNHMTSLGVRMLLPHGCEANVLPRSGTYKNFFVILANHEGVIDNPYNGPEDIWKANLIALGPCKINGPRLAYEEDYKNPDLTINDGYVCGDRILQFRVQLSQFATFKDKLRWFFSSGIELVIVDNIDTVANRGGFSKSGVK